MCESVCVCLYACVRRPNRVHLQSSNSFANIAPFSHRWRPVSYIISLFCCLPLVFSCLLSPRVSSSPALSLPSLLSLHTLVCLFRLIFNIILSQLTLTFLLSSCLPLHCLLHCCVVSRLNRRFRSHAISLHITNAIVPVLMRRVLETNITFRPKPIWSTLSVIIATELISLFVGVIQYGAIHSCYWV